MEKFSSSPRQADLMIVSGRVAHKMAAPLRQVYDQMLEPKWVIAMGACASSGGMFNNYTILQGVDKIVPVDIHVPGCPPRPEALMEGILRLHEKVLAGVPPAYEIRGAAAVMPYESVPGLVERREALGETTLVVDPARIAEACTHLRDEEGFNFLADITATDFLGWAEGGVAGYIGTPDGRDLNEPAAQGYARRPDPKPKRFSLSYHLLRMADEPARVRVQVWLDDGEAVRERRPGLADGRLARAGGLRHDGDPASTATRTSSGSSWRTTGKGIRCARTIRSAASPCASRERNDGGRRAQCNVPRADLHGLADPAARSRRC